MERSDSTITNTRVLWKDTVGNVADDYPPLAGDGDADVVVIGAGITGLTTAWHLLESGLDVMVLEAGIPGDGTTGSSTGNLYSPVGTRLFSIEKKHDRRTLLAVAAAREAAVDFIEERVRQQGIECDFMRVPFHLFTGPGDGNSADEVRREFAAARDAGLAVSNEVPADFPFDAAVITTVRNQAQFNPMQYATGLAAALAARGCRIHARTRVMKTEDGKPCRVFTAAGTVTARNVVKATHTPQGFYAVHAAMVPHREFAVVARLAEAPMPDGIYWDADPASPYSIRPYSNDQGNFLLVLGETRKPGHLKPEDLDQIEAFLRQRFPVESIDYVWAAQNYESADHLPYIGTSMLETNTWIATGFAADGLVWGTLAGKLISDGINRTANEWADMFDPKRFTPIASAKVLLEENLSVSRHLARDYLHYGEARQTDEIAVGEGKTLKIDGEKVAVYRDEQGQLSIVSAVCPHLGCIVHWNGVEKSWDCPCHGSRFSTRGELLEGPAFSDLAAPKGAQQAGEKRQASGSK